MSTTAQKTIAAGPFGHWLAQFRASLRGDAGNEVPCGDCTGCCISGYSVQVRPADKRALAKIPASLLVSAPGFARGDLTMAPRPDGVCPMLSAGQCTIYEDRPQTCLDYDCRIFAAAGIEAGGADKTVINQRVRQWQFSYPSEADRLSHEAVRAAARFIRQKHGSFPAGRAPRGPTGIAVLAIKAHSVFLHSAPHGRSETDTAMAIINASRDFDSGLMQ